MLRFLLSVIVSLSGLKLAAQPSLTPLSVKADSGRILNASVRGIWKSIGNNFLLDASTDSIVLYSTTSQHCYAEHNEYLSGLLNNGAHFSINQTKDTLSIYLQDFGARTRTLQSENKYYRLSELPKNCGQLTEKQKSDAEYLFNLFWITLRENYAHSAERNINWNDIYLTYRPKLSSLSTKYDLFDVMGQIVTLTKDQHTKIIAEDGETKQYRGEPSSRLLRLSLKIRTASRTTTTISISFFKLVIITFLQTSCTAKEKR